MTKPKAIGETPSAFAHRRIASCKRASQNAYVEPNALGVSPLENRMWWYSSYLNVQSCRIYPKVLFLPKRTLLFGFFLQPFQSNKKEIWFLPLGSTSQKIFRGPNALCETIIERQRFAKASPKPISAWRNAKRLWLIIVLSQSALRNPYDEPKSLCVSPSAFHFRNALQSVPIIRIVAINSVPILKTWRLIVSHISGHS